jgi:hypothetical protein
MMKLGQPFSRCTALCDNANRDRILCLENLFYHNQITMTSDPTKCTVLYKILTPDEHAGLPTESWTGTALDVSRPSRCHSLHFLDSSTNLTYRP